MHAQDDRTQALIAKIRELPDDRVAEVEDFVDFLRSRERNHVPVATASAGTEPLSSTQEGSTHRQADVIGSTRRGKPTGRRNGQDERHARFHRVYERYVKPVEVEHLGEYAAVTPDGQVIFGATLLEVMEKSYEISKTDNCLFKVGEIAAVSIL
jgi:hypothetical protein